MTKSTVGRISHVPNAILRDNQLNAVESFLTKVKSVKLKRMGGPVLDVSRLDTSVPIVRTEKSKITPNGPKISEVIQGYASSNRCPDAHVRAEIGTSSKFLPVKILMVLPSAVYHINVFKR